MPRLLTLSRAARLVGVRRGALQSKIRSGELTAFEGMVSAEAIKDSAFARRMRERLLPSSEVLVARLSELSRERAQMQAQLEHYRAIVEQLQAKLREQESFLRIMSAHVHVKPSGREFFIDGNDSLLEAALRAGLSLDYGCSAGSCGKCKARILSGETHRTRHSDYALTATEKNAGVVLMCCHTALTDLVIEAREAHGAADMPLQSIEARIKSVTPLGDGVRLLHLQTPRSNRLRFLAGQSASLALADGSSTSVPIASCPCDDRNLQFHIRRSAADAFAERVFGGLKGVDCVRIEGPRGQFVLSEESHRPLIFIAGESGFAPIKSLIEHALALDAAETLHLYWIASSEGGHYLDNLCRAWSDALDNFHYEPVTGALDEKAVQAPLRHHPQLGDCDVYVAGPGPWVSAAEFELLEQGVPRAQLKVSGMET